VQAIDVDWVVKFSGSAISQILWKVGDTFRSAIWKKQNLRLIQSDQGSDGAFIIDMLRSVIWQWKCHWYIQIGYGYL